jgi:hypothetical protein
VLTLTSPLATPPVPVQRVLVPESTSKSKRATNPASVPCPASSRYLPARPSRRSTRQRTKQGHGPLAQAATTAQYQSSSNKLAQAPIAPPASHKYEHHIAALATPSPNAGNQGSLKKCLRSPDAAKWTRSLSNEWGQALPHGIGRNRPPKERIKGTGTVSSIKKSQVPKGRVVTYANFVCDIRPQKTETHRVRMTAGGNKLDYPSYASSPAVSVLAAKVHLLYYPLHVGAQCCTLGRTFTAVILWFRKRR